MSLAKTDYEKTALQRPDEQSYISECFGTSHPDATDRQIDQLVYELYGLTEEEIRIVEGSGRELILYNDSVTMDQVMSR